MPPRSRRRGAGPLIAVILTLALLGGSLFAAVQLGLFGKGGDDDAVERPAPPPATARPTEPAPAAAPETSPARTVVVEAPPPPPAAEPTPAPGALPPAARSVEADEPPSSRARSKKRAKRSSPARGSAPARPAVTGDGADDNTIDPFR